MDVKVVMKAECPFIVKFYGALFREGEVSWTLYNSFGLLPFNLKRLY